MDRTQELANRLADLEEQTKNTRLDVYSRWYTAIAPLLATLTFVPYLDGDSSPTLWETAGEGAGTVLMIATVTVLIGATRGAFRPQSMGAMWTMLLSAVITILLLGVRLGAAQSSRPDHLSWAGGATFFLLIALIALALSNMVQIVAVNKLP